MKKTLYYIAKTWHATSLLTAYCFCLLLLFTACEDKLNSEAEIIISFKVTNEAGKVFNATIGNDNTITVKVSPFLNAEAELAVAVPSFYISRGATVSPDPSLSQNFAQPGGVKYVVTAEDRSTQREYTVTWDVSDKMPYGSGFSYAEIGTQKNFVELGYPGEFNNYDLEFKLYGDLYVYHAYCDNYIVLLSRAYALADPASPHALKVVDKNTLAPAGFSLNLGSIAITDLKMLTSDYKGRCVGAVVTSGNSNETEFLYWTTPSAAPVSIGKIGVNMAAMSLEVNASNTPTDPSSNFQVAGDITGNAWITAAAPHSATGDHYRVKVTGGQLASTWSTISTGYSSSDCSWFQMISPLDDSDTPSFVVGDVEGTVQTAGSSKTYINTYAGATIATLPSNLWTTLFSWWVGTGFALSRNGGRAPVVSGMVVNGKSYVVVTTGTGWVHGAAVLLPDLSTSAHENLNITGSVNRAWCFGSWVDWYWNEDESEAYLAVWFDRIGLYTYKLTCFE